MTKIKIPKPEASVASAANGAKSSAPAICSLIFGVISWFLGWLFVPLACGLIAVICGHIGRKNARQGAGHAGLSLAGLILGYSSLIFWIFIFAVIIPQYTEYMKKHRTTSEAQTEVVTQANNKTAQNQSSDNTVALEKAKLLVGTKVIKGTPLNQVNETLSLDAQQKKYWRDIIVRQGSVYATPAQGGDPLVLMSLEKNKNIQWICAGKIPQSVTAFCNNAQ